MKLGARNVLPVTGIARGAVNALLRIDIGRSAMTAAITGAAVEDPGLTVGGKAGAALGATGAMAGGE